MAKSSILGSGAIALLALLLFAANGTQVHAQTRHPGLNFSLSIVGVPGCDTSATGAATCTMPPGTPFTMHINLVSPPTGFEAYLGFDLYYQYTGVTPAGDPTPNTWPDCGIPVYAPEPGNVLMGCAVGLPPAPSSSTYLGPIASAPFTCTQSGSIVMQHEDGDTDLIVVDTAIQTGQLTLMEQSPTDTLTINCASGAGAVTPVPENQITPEPTRTPLEPTAAAVATATAKAVATKTQKTVAPTPGGTSSGGGGGGGIPGWAIGVIVLGVAAGVGGAGYAGWRYWQSRAGTSGPT